MSLSFEHTDDPRYKRARQLVTAGQYSEAAEVYGTLLEALCVSAPLRPAAARGDVARPATRRRCKRYGETDDKCAPIYFEYGDCLLTQVEVRNREAGALALPTQPTNSGAFRYHRTAWMRWGARRRRRGSRSSRAAQVRVRACGPRCKRA